MANETMQKAPRRYEKMRDSGVEWIGMVPSHWEIVRARAHFRQTNERGNQTPVLLAASQKFGVCPQDQLEGVVKVSVGTDLQQFKSVHRNDFIISLRSFQGGFELSPFEGVCSPAYQVFHTDDAYDVKYLRFLFKDERFIDHMNSLTVGIRDGKNIKYSDFSNSLIILPPLDEQRAIAKYLSQVSAKIDTLIGEIKASIEEYKAWKSSIIYEAVTKGLDPNAEMKDSGVEWIGRMPKNWMCCALKRVSSIQTGGTPSKQSDEGYYATNGIPWIKPDNLGISNPIRETKEYLTETGSTCVKVFPPNTVYVCCIGSIGKIGFSDTFCACNQQINAVRFNEKKVFWKFGYYALLAQEAQHWFYSNGNVLKILNTSNQAKIVIAIPSVSMQKKIVQWLDIHCTGIEELIREKQSLIENLEAYKKSLIYEVVTGKRKVV